MRLVVADASQLEPRVLAETLLGAAAVVSDADRVGAARWAAEPSQEERQAIEARLERGGPIEEAISNATAALSGMSACAGIVLVPKEEPVLKQLAFVPLSPHQAVAVSNRWSRARPRARSRALPRRRRRCSRGRR